MKNRVLTSVVAASLAVVGLAGCRTNVGVAARVGNATISESKVSGYLSTAGVDPSFAARAQAAGQTLSSRSEVLGYLIQEQLFQRTLSALGKLPTEGQLAALHDVVGRTFFQNPLAGSALDDALRTNLVSLGVRTAFLPTVLRVLELEVALVDDQHLTSLAGVVAATQRANAPVSVSARYGTWQPSSLSLTGTPAVPAYLTIQPSTAGG